MKALVHALVLATSSLSFALVHAQAPGQDRVLLFEDSALRPGLCGALRIQLTALAQVSCLEVSADTALSQPLDRRIERAARMVRQEHARLGVLLERDPDQRLIRMLLVGENEDHALLAIERIEDRPAPDVDRSLALKARDALDALIEATKAARDPHDGVELAAALAATGAGPDEPRDPTSRPRRTWSALLEAGAGLSLGKLTRSAGLLAVGARRTGNHYYGELALAAVLLSGLDERAAPGRVSEQEWRAEVVARVGRQWQRLALGLSGQVGVVRLSVSGTTADGTTGQTHLAIARLGIGIDLRVLLFDGPARCSLKLTPTLLVDPAAQRFLLDQKLALEPGRAQLWLPLTLLVELPSSERGAGGRGHE